MSVKYKDIIEYFLYKANKIFKEKTQSSRFRALNYKKVANIIEQKCNSLNTIIDHDFIINLPITNYMKKQILEFKKPKNIKINKKEKLFIELKKILGIGDEKAKMLINEGLKNINELKLKKWQDKLSEETKIYLSNTPEKPIPFLDIQKIEKLIKKLKFKLEFVGSYRRKKINSNDIDIMIISDDELILDKFLLALIKLTKNKVYLYSKGPDKMSLIIDTEKITSEKHIYKIDVFRCSNELYIPMLLYSTGSKEFNIKMRSIAKRKGYLLNQNGLFNKNSQKKIDNLKSEKDYFDFLEMEYKLPEDRI